MLLFANALKLFDIDKIERRACPLDIPVCVRFPRPIKRKHPGHDTCDMEKQNIYI